MKGIWGIINEWGRGRGKRRKGEGGGGGGGAHLPDVNIFDDTNIPNPFARYLQQSV
jgi:hypothetical protein